AASGHAITVLLKSLMNSRRLMASPAPRTKSGIKRLSHFWIENCAVRRTQAGPQPCPLWVKSGHRSLSNQSPLYPQKRTLRGSLDDLVGPAKSELATSIVDNSALSSCRLDGGRAGPFGGEFHRVTVKVVDVDAGVDDARNTVWFGADAVAGKLPQPSARPVA